MGRFGDVAKAVANEARVRLAEEREAVERAAREARTAEEAAYAATDRAWRAVVEQAASELRGEGLRAEVDATAFDRGVAYIDMRISNPIDRSGSRLEIVIRASVSHGTNLLQTSTGSIESGRRIADQTSHQAHDGDLEAALSRRIEDALRRLYRIN